MEHSELIRSLSERYDSFYLYDGARVAARAAHLQQVFAPVEFLYSIKCNPNPHILDTLFARGFGADAASLGEVLMAVEHGLKKDQIYFSAPGKTQRDIDEALPKSVLIADSLGEVGRIDKAAKAQGVCAEIGLRINPNFSFSGEGGHPSKFGIDEDDALALVRANPYENVKVTGIHVHVKSQELDGCVLAAYYGRMIGLARRFADVCGELAYVNMGSGIGVPFADSDREVDVEALHAAAKAPLDAFRADFPGTRVFIETGRYTTCRSGVYVTKVVDRKVSHGKTYLLLKNTLNGFLRPSVAVMVGKYTDPAAAKSWEPLFTCDGAFRFTPLKGGEATETVTLAGNLCTGTDLIAEDIPMPQLAVGDLIVIDNAGSYASVLSPMQFASQDKPAEIFLSADGSVLAD